MEIQYKGWMIKDINFNYNQTMNKLILILLLAICSCDEIPEANLVIGDIAISTGCELDTTNFYRMHFEREGIPDIKRKEVREFNTLNEGSYVLTKFEVRDSDNMTLAVSDTRQEFEVIEGEITRLFVELECP